MPRSRPCPHISIAVEWVSDLGRGLSFGPFKVRDAAQGLPTRSCFSSQGKSCRNALRVKGKEDSEAVRGDGGDIQITFMTPRGDGGKRAKIGHQFSGLARPSGRVRKTSQMSPTFPVFGSGREKCQIGRQFSKRADPPFASSMEVTRRSAGRRQMTLASFF
ncbi:hypothetical protein B0J15DRAFT_227993 [Fusarium solani]|uniref:Uncharacterized protein n=1 Tax=Fusarium solani TaxID=169388 RepID=A0A9P9G1Z4_FUSSL|nr:uncharacterized protein B0J15DRAFT_227993 [Fusarium solani]KAH7229974.1 hypothetical protein B0J15DRAFT_227993 [Fusarium solani]